ncbi:MAG: YeeE/YedE family protein [Vicinamibacterales bacterium]
MSLGVASAVLVAAYLQRAVGSRQAALFAVGTIAGVVLYHAAFGFTSAWRALIWHRRGGGVRVQMLMLGLGCLAFVPLLSWGSVSGQVVRGSVAPLSVAVLAGAFLFGIGMQLGGGCASGTLYAVGGGSSRAVVTLMFFIIGSVVGTAHAPFWDALPSWGTVSLLQRFGALGALGVSLTLIAFVWLAATVVERREHGRVTSIWILETGSARWLSGPWPLVWGAVGLVVVNVATLVLAGRPWGVTSAFALWGAKAALALGFDVVAWPYWAAPVRAASLTAPIAADVTSVMDVGIMLGALSAAGCAGRFAPVWRIPVGSLVAAMIGGLLLGYGARVAYGCNIGAYFSGVISTSLHGWLWCVSAFVGSVAGTRMRGWFGLPA